MTIHDDFARPWISQPLSRVLSPDAPPGPDAAPLDLAPIRERHESPPSPGDMVREQEASGGPIDGQATCRGAFAMGVAAERERTLEDVPALLVEVERLIALVSGLERDVAKLNAEGVRAGVRARGAERERDAAVKNGERLAAMVDNVVAERDALRAEVETRIENEAAAANAFAALLAAVEEARGHLERWANSPDDLRGNISRALAALFRGSKPAEVCSCGCHRADPAIVTGTCPCKRTEAPAPGIETPEAWHCYVVRSVGPRS